MTASPDPAARRPAAGPVPAALVLSVADLLRREGRRTPHAGHGPLVPRGHASFPVPSVVAVPRTRRRVAAATGMVVAAGAVVGAAMTMEPVQLGSTAAPTPDPTGNVGPTGPGGGADDPYSAFAAPGTGPAGRPGTAPPGPGPLGTPPLATGPLTSAPGGGPLALDGPAVDGAGLVEMVRSTAGAARSGPALPEPGPPVVTGADIAALLTGGPAAGPGDAPAAVPGNAAAPGPGNAAGGPGNAAAGQDERRSGNDRRTAGDAGTDGQDTSPASADTVVLRAVSASTDDAPQLRPTDEPPTDEPRTRTVVPGRGALARAASGVTPDDRATDDLLPAGDGVDGPAADEDGPDRAGSESGRDGDAPGAVDRSGPDRAPGDRPAGDRFEFDRTELDGFTVDRSDPDASENDATEDESTQGDRSEGDRPEDDRPEDDRPEDDRPESDRPEGEDAIDDPAAGDPAAGDPAAGDDTPDDTDTDGEGAGEGVPSDRSDRGGDAGAGDAPAAGDPDLSEVDAASPVDV